jgi:hypothetical protein
VGEVESEASEESGVVLSPSPTKEKEAAEAWAVLKSPAFLLPPEFRGEPCLSGRFRSALSLGRVGEPLGDESRV